MRGRTEVEARAELEAQGIGGDQLDLLARAKTFGGNQPTNSFLYRKLTPETLGTLIAFYELKNLRSGHHLEHQLV